MPGLIQSFFQDIEQRFEITFHKAKLIAGVCDAPTLEQVKDLLELGEQLTNRAKTATAFANSLQILGQAGDSLGGAADAIDKLVSKGAGVAGDVSAACEISAAISVLNDWALPNSRTSNEEAAKAFDKLFQGSSRYMAKLPFPASSYAKILAAIGEYNFFSNMRGLLDPENPNTPSGRAMREALGEQ